MLEICFSSKSFQIIFNFNMKGCNFNIIYNEILRSEPKSIIKVGEGTYGEAFKAGKTVCKVVPFDGDLRVNGEVQKVMVFSSNLVFIGF